jgi:DNA-binding MarR family transcriptional regulator
VDLPDRADDSGQRALTTDEERVLAFMAEHRLVEVAHVQRLLNVSSGVAQARLRTLRRADYVCRERPFDGRATFHMITTKGLGKLGTGLRRPRFDLSCHQHDVGLAWLWLAAAAGAFGQMSQVISERRMRSRDATASLGSEPMAVKLGGLGAGGRERLHYPDLLLVTPGGQRIAVELELTSKGRARRERILSGYAADVRIDAVLYLVPNKTLGRTIQASARAMGIEHLVHVQRTSLPERGARLQTEAAAVRRHDRTRSREAVR